MALDIVELVTRCEETFKISIRDDQAEQVQTVGDLYCTICRGLQITPLADPTLTSQPRRYFLAAPATRPWTPENVWSALIFIVTDQLQVEEAEVTFDAHFQRDLGAD